MVFSTARASTRRCAPTTASHSCSIVTCAGCATRPGCCHSPFRSPMREIAARFARHDARGRARIRGPWRGVHPDHGDAGDRRAVLRPGRLPRALDCGHREAAHRSAFRSVRARGESGARADHPESSGVGEPSHQVEQPAQQRAGDAGGGPAGGIRRRDAELPRRARRVHDVEPVHREERRGAHAAARCRAAAGHHAGIPVRDRGRRRHRRSRAGIERRGSVRS